MFNVECSVAANDVFPVDTELTLRDALCLIRRKKVAVNLVHTRTRLAASVSNPVKGCLEHKDFLRRDSAFRILRRVVFELCCGCL